MSASKRVTGEKIWIDGAFVPWDAARVHILTHTLHYGLGVFEGIRCYRTADDRSAVFRLGEHVRRLFESAHINLMTVPFTQAQIAAAIGETLRANEMREGYIRPLVYIGHGAMGLNPGDNPIRVAIATWPWGKYLGDEGVERGIRAKISTFSRQDSSAQKRDKLLSAGSELFARGLDKSDEMEADRLGVVIAARAGYDAYGLPAVLQTLQAMNPADSGLALMFKTHPAPAERLDALERMQPTLDAYAAQQQLAARFMGALGR